MEQQKPLAEFLRPKSLDEIVGQQHLVGANGILRALVKKGEIASMILWGPPGTGKTTMARIISKEVGATFIELSATDSGVKDIRNAIKRSRTATAHNDPDLFSAPDTRQRVVLFIDEIHRFSKAQQDSLLAAVEDGTITLIGATTENPSFEVIAPLLSRSRIFILNPLNEEQIFDILRKAVENARYWSSAEKLVISQDLLKLIATVSNGDARVGLNMLELATKLSHAKGDSIVVTENIVRKAIANQYVNYDKNGDYHYHTISAFIKSMRAGDVDASIYYLARMIKAGEDPKFIARRMVIFASEDVGLANPTALVVANAAFRACEIIGYPECAINLAQATIYLTRCKKDRSAYEALRKAQEDVNNFGNLPIPLKLRNAPTRLMKDLHYGDGYEMYPSKGSLLPDKLTEKKYYKPPTNN